MSVVVAPWRFTVDDYHRMAEAGIFHEDDRVELIEGEVVAMVPIGSRHAACVKKLAHLLRQALGDSAIIGVQDPVHLGPRSEPQPDISVLRPRNDYYAGGHPKPEDILLLIEVADASLGYDRLTKLPLYARSGINEVWLVDLVANAVEVHSKPASGAYTETKKYERSSTALSPTLTRINIRAEEILVS